MNENQLDPESENSSTHPVRSARPLWIAAIVALCLAAVAVAFIVDQHKIASQLSARNQELTTSLTQTQGQMQALGSELNAMKTEEAAREEAELTARHPTPVYHARYRSPHRVVKKDDPRWKQ